MGKGKRLELLWQLYRTSLPVRDLENFRPMDFCSTRVYHTEERSYLCDKSKHKVEVIFTDVSGQLIGPILTVQESKNNNNNAPEWRSSQLLRGGSPKSRQAAAVRFRSKYKTRKQ